MKDTDQQVKYTRNEENIHALVGIQIINTIRQEHPELFDAELEQRIQGAAQEAFLAESKIVDWMVNGIDEKSLSAPILKEFIKNRINESMKQISMPLPFTDVDQELLSKTVWFDEELLGNNMTDFFHSRPTEYSKKNQSFGEDDLF
jgi:ribonucleoside-diphosphate reductase beta chain